MYNIEEHAIQVGGLTLEERPFDEIDSLILTQIVYMPMEGFLDRETRADIKDLWAFLRQEYPDSFTDPFQRKRYSLTRVCAEAPRYRGFELHDYVNKIDVELEMQFAACAFDLPTGYTAIAFRGTDLTLAGWKEDLNMSFMTVPSQREAVEYTERIAAQSGRGLYLTGHSKGGNLSVYAGANVSGATRDRIRRVHSFDGPGMDEDTLLSLGYELVRERIESYIPQSSVVGMLLNYHPVYTVVRSKSLGILQHDAMTWQVEDGRFVTLKELDLSGRLTDEAIHNWLKEMDFSARRLLVDTLYQVVAAAQAETVSGLVKDWQESSVRMLEALRELPRSTRKSVRRMLSLLFSTGAAEAIRMILPRSLLKLGQGMEIEEEGNAEKNESEPSPAQSKG